MNADGMWLALLIMGVAGLTLFLRVTFPNASKASEAVVLLTVTIVFFSGCTLLLPRHTQSALREAQSSAFVPSKP